LGKKSKEAKPVRKEKPMIIQEAQEEEQDFPVKMIFS